jgi:hypothetical protein
MMPTPRATGRPPADRAADRATATGLVADLRAARADLRAALRALPAPAQRTAAQRRDALLLRTAALLVQAQLVGWGAATSTDREQTEA